MGWASREGAAWHAAAWRASLQPRPGACAARPAAAAHELHRCTSICRLPRGRNTACKHIPPYRSPVELQLRQLLRQVHLSHTHSCLQNCP